MLNQKEGVFVVVSELCVIENSKCVIGDEKSLVIDKLCVMFEENEIEMSERGKLKYIGNRSELRKYVGGLLNNWLRKDVRLNGGDKYITKNPGSRVGNSDEMLKNLRNLLKVVDDEKKKIVEKSIEERIEEIRVEKSKDVEVDMSLISDELKKKLGIEEDED